MDSKSNSVGGVSDSGQVLSQDDATDVEAANSSPTANAHVEQLMGGAPMALATAAAPKDGVSSQAAATPLSIQAPQVADDNDLIEPEWVDGAKAIIERTHDDPYLQNQELSKLKADYMMKRYKKTIKVTED
jgi:hypothetical protein